MSHYCFSEPSVLVTGGAGYIGSVLVERLLLEGWKVTVLDNFYYNQPSLLHLCKYENLKIVKGDVRDESLLKEFLKDADVIFPLAALTGLRICDEKREEAKSVNYEAIKKLCNLVSKEQIVIFPNTNSGYGRTTGEVFCSEETPLNPISWYGITKVEAEKVVTDLNNFVVFRLATVFGVSPRMRFDLLVNDFVYQAVKNRYIVVYEGHYKRNFVHVSDVANAFVFAVKNYSKLKCEVFNLGYDPANMSKLELANLVSTMVGNIRVVSLEFDKDPDQRNYIVSSEKLKQRGFCAKVPLEEGIKELQKAYTFLVNSNPIYTNSM